MAKIFSGEPLPVPPKTSNPELDAFHRKVVDYLRRLAGRLDLTGGGGGGSGNQVEVFAAHREPGVDVQIVTGAGEAAIPWEIEVRKDPSFTHSANSSVVTVNQDGFYIVEVDVTNAKNALLEFHINVNGTPVDYSYSGDISVFASIAYETYSFVVPLNLNNGDGIEVIMTQFDATTVGKGTRILVTRIGEIV